MKIIQITMDAELVAQVDECAQRIGASRSGFTRKALRDALRRHNEKELEKRHRAGYRRIPSEPGEFAVSENHHAWGDEAWSES